MASVCGENGPITSGFNSNAFFFCFFHVTVLHKQTQTLAIHINFVDLEEVCVLRTYTAMGHV